MTLAEKIVKYRVEYGLSQLEFAKLVGTSQSQIFRLENGSPHFATTERKILNLIEKQ